MIGVMKMLNEKECKNTLEFKNFKLHADSTLKSMSKDELINYIYMLHHNWSVSDEQLFNVIEKIKTLQNEVDYYKHEYYSECDKNEMLERALDKACEELEHEFGQVHSDMYEWSKKQWKEWCLKDD